MKQIHLVINRIGYMLNDVCPQTRNIVLTYLWGSGTCIDFTTHCNRTQADDRDCKRCVRTITTSQHQLLHHFDDRPRSEVTRRIDQRVDHRGMVMARRGAKAGAARPESGATPPWLTEKDRNSERTRGNNRQTGSARTGVRTASHVVDWWECKTDG